MARWIFIATMTGAAVFFAAFPLPAISPAIPLHIQQAESAIMADPKRALSEADAARAKLVTEPASNEKTLAAARIEWLTGAALVGLDRAPEALAATERGLNTGVGEIAPRSKLYGDLVFAHATALSFLGRFELGLAELRRAYQIYGEAGQRRGQALALQNIGMVYAQARDYPHALQYFEQSAETFRSDPALLLTIANNEAGALKEQGNFEKSIARYRYALSLAHGMKSPMLQVRILAGLADAELKAGKIEAAERSVSEGMRLSAMATSSAWRPGIDAVAAETALRQGKIGRAATLIEEALQGDATNSAPLLRDIHRTAYEIYKAKGAEGKALEHLEAFKTLEDRIRAVAASANAALMSAQFDFANQRASIAQLRTNEIQSEAKIARSQRTILLILLAGTGIVTTLLLFGFISIRRSRDQVRAANEELSETNVELGQALAARTQFLATTSHEIRTPLNGILGMTQVLLADRELDEKVKSRIELVHGAGETMRALVDDILDVAKMTTGELKMHPAEMNLHRLLRDTTQVWASQAQSKGITIALELTDTPEHIVGDEVRLRQIVFNLTANAVKFTDRGEVRMTARVIDEPNGERLQLTVKDTGIGIPQDKFDEIFESFRQVDSGTTRRHGGTGLGLAICRSLAQAMGGDITVSSVLGAGATFTLDIPLERAAVAAATSVAPQGTLPSARLLLVEANPLTQSILRAVLTPKVAGVSVVGNAEEARAAIEAGEIDLLLLDANTIERSLATAAALAKPVTDRGGRAVLLWPGRDETVAAGAAEAGISLLLATPIAAPDLVSALTTIYVPERAPEEIAA